MARAMNRRWGEGLKRHNPGPEPGTTESAAGRCFQEQSLTSAASEDLSRASQALGFIPQVLKAPISFK